MRWRTARRTFVGQALRLPFGAWLSLHFFPNAAFLLPVVERFAVDLVNGRFRNAQFAGLQYHKKIDIIQSAVRAFHIDTGEIFVSAETREPIIMNSDQIQRQILALKWDVKFFIGGFRRIAADEFL